MSWGNLPKGTINKLFLFFSIAQKEYKKIKEEEEEKREIHGPPNFNK